MTQIFNKYKNCLISLNEGEEFCKKCHGEGMVTLKKIGSGMFSKKRVLVCNKCFGTGKLDWVEEAIGKRGRMTSGTDQSPS
jgi:DnaJ-class molecular chaperone